MLQGVNFANNYREIMTGASRLTSTGLITVALSDAVMPQAPIAIVATKKPIRMVMHQTSGTSPDVQIISVNPYRLMANNEFFRLGDTYSMMNQLFLVSTKSTLPDRTAH
jgi:hypothetical protein